MRNLTKLPTPRVPFGAFAKALFPSSYELSIVIVGNTLAQKLNRTYRKKSYIPNVLSFPISKQAGEIFLNLSEARRQWESGIVSGTWLSFVALLVIHSMLHSKGIQHGRTMETRLEKILRENGFRAKLLESHKHVQTHRYRN